MTEIWTIQRLLLWTRDYLTKHGSPSARIDAELLLGATLKLRRLELLLRFDQPVLPKELAEFKAFISRRAKGEPVAYILGHKEFYGLDLRVDRHVLVPRPETESLVDAVLAFLQGPLDGKHAPDAKALPAPAGDVLDLCTGSGAIAIAVADALRQRHDTARKVVATDVCDQAVAVALGNVRHHGLDSLVQVHTGDLFAAVPLGAQFAVVVSNPPYVLHDRIATLDRDVRDFEPWLALDGGRDGLAVLRRIASEVDAFLVPGGLCAVELGSREQGAVMAAALTAGGLAGARVEPLQGGPTSLVLARKPA